MEEITEDIVQSTLFTPKCTPIDLDDLVHSYSTTLSQTLDKHAPATTKEVIVRPHTPWFSEGMKTAKQERRRAERKWNKSKSTADREAVKEKQRAFNDLWRGGKDGILLKHSQQNTEELKRTFSSCQYTLV